MADETIEVDRENLGQLSEVIREESSNRQQPPVVEFGVRGRVGMIASHVGGERKKKEGTSVYDRPDRAFCSHAVRIGVALTKAMTRAPPTSRQRALRFVPFFGTILTSQTSRLSRCDEASE